MEKKKQVRPRKDKRRGTDGRLVVRLNESGKTIEGDLLDVSRRGFRLRHKQAALRAGQRVQVLYSWGEVWARVKWNRRDGSWYQSGFELEYPEIGSSGKAPSS
jgi:hypothetical protein